MMPDLDLTEASNFCRSPDRDTYGPWCYTTDPDVVWEYCDVIKCTQGVYHDKNLILLI